MAHRRDHARSAAASAARTARAQVPTRTRVRRRATRLAVHFSTLAATFIVWCTTGTSWCWKTGSGSSVSGYATGVGTMGFGRRIVSLTGARRALLFDRSHVWKSSSSARGAGLCGNYFVATPARWRDFHTGRRCSRAQTQNWGSSLHTRSYDSPAWGPTEKVVRGPVSAGLRTRTPGVGLKSRACAAVAVARRRIMVLGAARASRYGVLPLRQGPAGWGSARAPPPRFSGGAAGRASSGGFGTRVDSQCGGESASMAAREARICGEHGPLVQTSAQFQRSRRHGGKPSPDASPAICRGCSSERRPRAASRPRRNRRRRTGGGGVHDYARHR